MANTNAGSKLSIAVLGTAEAPTGPAPQNEDLTEAEFAALVWLQVKSVGSVGETGSNPNVVSYDTWDTTVTQKGAGVTNAGDPEVELARIAADPGQMQMRAAAEPANRQNNFAFKIERLNGTVLYNRGLCLGPRNPNGRNEDFVLEVYTLALNQEQITVDA